MVGVALGVNLAPNYLPVLSRTFALLPLMLGLPLAAEPVDFQPLLGRSPFGQPPAAPVQAPVETPNLEFRGIVVEGGARYYSVFNASTQRGEWVREGDAKATVQVTEFDAENNVLVVVQNGRPLRLTLKESTISTLAVAPTPAAGGARQGGPRPTGNNNAAVTPAPADAQRLEAIAAEVRRRRALRQSAGNATP